MRGQPLRCGAAEFKFSSCSFFSSVTLFCNYLLKCLIEQEIGREMILTGLTLPTSLDHLYVVYGYVEFRSKSKDYFYLPFF
jgi:hypothetical protein